MTNEIVDETLFYYPSASRTRYAGSLRVVAMDDDECSELSVPNGSLKVATLDQDDPHRLVIVTPDTIKALKAITSRK